MRDTGPGLDRAVWTALLVLALTAFGCSKTPEDRAATHRARAERLVEEGKYREASIEYQAALQQSPNDAESLYRLALVLDAMGQLGEYRKTLLKAVEADPNHARAGEELGALYWAAGDYDKAIELAQRVLAVDPNSIEARKLEARSLAGLGRAEEARAAWDMVLVAGAATDQAYFDAAESEAWSGDRSHALEILQRGLQRFPTSAVLLMVKANFSMEDGNLEAAEAELKRAAQADPENPDVRAAWAKLLIRKGMLEEGLQELTEAQELFSGDDEKSAKMVLHRAQVFLRLGKLDEARQVLETERERSPDHPELAAVLADVLITLGQTDQALDLLSVAWRADPMGRRASLLAARVFLVDGRPQRALHVLERLVAMGDRRIDTHLLYATALTRAKRWAKARLEYLLVLRRVPEHHLARIDYAGLLLALGDHDGAADEIAMLPDRLRESPRVELLRARIELGEGDTEAAAELVEKLMENAPEDAAIVKLMGDVEQARNRPTEALEFYRRARKLSPTALDPLVAEVSLLAEQDEELRKVVKLIDDYQSEYGENAILLNLKASIYLREKHILMATNTIERSLLVDPNNWINRYMSAQISLASGDQIKAMVELQEAITLEPLQPNSYNLLAEIQRQRGELDKAEKTYQLLLDRNRGEPLTANNLANLYLEQNEVDKALKLAWVAKAGAPKNPHVLDTLGWALELSGRSEEAKPFLRQAAASLPDSPEVLLHWGVNLQSRQMHTEAREVFGDVVRLAPQSRSAARASELLQARSN